MSGLPNFSSEETNNSLSVIKDPFIEDGLKDINIYYRGKPMFGGRPYWYATIDFENDLSTGKQRTPNCDTYTEMMGHLQNILNSIKDKK